MNRRFGFCVEEFYHAYNRGTDKRVIFLDDEDYRYFIALLFLCNSVRRITMRSLPHGFDLFAFDRTETIIDIGCFCLMPNHFHLFLHEKSEGGISKFMQKLCTAYVAYFNKKYGRTGGLFEGVFKATHVAEDAYFQYLFAYIHLNPIKLIEPKWKEEGIKDLSRAEKYLKDYEYSSYLDYTENKPRKYGRIINKKAFPFEQESETEFKQFVSEWLNYKDEFTLSSEKSVEAEEEGDNEQIVEKRESKS